jgi:S-adenosylmethionine-diacylglycerol 3-amino-3-carboxypropyl transferase
MSVDAPAQWTVEACRLPIAFAQVREDPAIDLDIVARAGPGARVAMVASGGCTAAALAAESDAAAITCVDPNPAQIALGRLKVALLEETPPERLRLLGHEPMAASERASRIAEISQQLELAPGVFGPPERTAQVGLDHAGRYEALFFALRDELAPVSTALESLLALQDPAEQARRADPAAPLGAALDRAFDRVMSYPNLVALFGDAATRNPRQPFSRHFAERLRAILDSLPAAGNPFLAQMLLGRFTPGHAHLWLRAPAARPRAALTWYTGPMSDALEDRAGAFDVVHLSNMLDWLSPDEAREQLDLARSALRPGGWVVVRQLNSTLDIPLLAKGFAWDFEHGAALAARDRSFFYRTILAGTRS